MAKEQLRVEVYRGGDLVHEQNELVDEQSDVDVTVEEVEPEQYSCGDCDKSFDSEKGLKSHRRQVH